MPELERVRENAERITLVHAASEHAQLLYDIFTGTNTQKYSPVGETTVNDVARCLGRSGKSFAEKAPFYRVFGKADNVLFGTCILKTIDWDAGEAEIGFSLLQEWQGKGLGTALVYKYVTRVFEGPEIGLLWGTVSETNQTCKRLMRRLGFVDCGFYIDAFPIQGRLVRQVLFVLSRERAAALRAEE